MAENDGSEDIYPAWPEDWEDSLNEKNLTVKLIK